MDNSCSKKLLPVAFALAAFLCLGALTACNSASTNEGIAGTWYQSGAVKTGTLTVDTGESEWELEYSGLSGFGSGSGTISNLGDGKYEFTYSITGNARTLTLSADGSMLMLENASSSSDLGGVWYRSQEEAAASSR